MNASLVASLNELSRGRLRELETSCGAFLSVTRLLQLENDSRWECLYAAVTAGDSLIALLPLYAPRHERWFDPAYEVAAQPPSTRPTSAAPASQWILVGGRTDLACGFLRSETASAGALDGAARAAGAVARREARRRGRRMLALFANDWEAHFIRAAFGDGSQHWELTHETRFEKVAARDREYLAALKPSHRAVVRRDWHRRDAAGLTSEVLSWDEVWDEAITLVHAVGQSHGKIDHKQLIRVRLQSWLANTEIEPVAFRVSLEDTPLAICLAWRWRTMLQLYEVGLVARETPGRHLAYAEAIIYAPLRYARSAGCSVVWTGLRAIEPKRLRGATVTPVHAFAERVEQRAPA